MDNQQIFFVIFSLQNQLPWLTPIFTFADYFPYLIFATASIIALTGGKKERKSWTILTIGILLSFPLINFIHLFIQTPRPFITYNFQPLIAPLNSFSFPSAHTTAMSIMAFAYFFTKSKWAWPFLILTLFVGFTRIYVGVHYPTDVLGGFFLGFIISSGVNYLLSSLRRQGSIK